VKILTFSVSVITAQIANIRLGLKRDFLDTDNIPGLLVNALPSGAAFSVSVKIFFKD
jgi:hypothetical protein